jgi:phosphatidylglycerophosphate synthase
MAALFLLLWGIEGPSLDEVEHVVKMSLTELLGRVLLWVSAVLTVVTGYAYFKAARKHFETP